jgi:hypothetical protein
LAPVTKVENLFIYFQSNLLQDQQGGDILVSNEVKEHLATYVFNKVMEVRGQEIARVMGLIEIIYGEEELRSIRSYIEERVFPKRIGG